MTPLGFDRSGGDYGFGSEDQCAANTDRELWREGGGDGDGMSYYEPSIHVTAQGGIGINVGGRVFTMPLRAWHHLAEVAHSGPELPPDLERVLRDQSVIVPQDAAVFASMMTPEMETQIAAWAKASSDTPSALSSEDATRPTGDKE